jgi:hypothetical protein
VTGRAFLASRGGRWVVSVLALTVAWQAWLSYQASGKIPADLASYVSSRGTVDLKVTLRFPPERFHTLTMQRFGRVSGTDGDTIEVRGVAPGSVWTIARFYWVRRITPFRD